MKRKDDFIMQNVGGEYLLVPLGAQVMDMNAIITLNTTSAYIWSLLDQDRSVDEITTAVAERFEVDHASARADVQKFLDEITGLGLLQ